MIFPALVPSSLPLSLGTFPASTGETQAGNSVIVRHSDVETGVTWSPEFVGLSYEEWQSIVQHWASQGTVSSFLFSTTTLPAIYTPAGYRWWYNETPTCVDNFDEFFTIQCSFRCDLSVSVLAPTGPEIYFFRSNATAFTPAPTSAPSAPTLSVTDLANGVTTDGFVEVSAVTARASWQYSTDSGGSWSTGAGNGFRLAQGDYSAGQIRVRQVTSGGTSSASQNAGAFTVAPSGSVVIAFTAAAGATTTGTVTLPAMGRIVWIRLQHAGWFTLYASQAAATADAARLYSTRPDTGSGVCCDPRLLAGDTRLAGLGFMPLEDFRNQETPATTLYPWKHRNEDNQTRTYAIILQIVA
jgi:hypothetical protein